MKLEEKKELELRSKLCDEMNAVIKYVSEQEAERDELVHAIALAFLTRKNLFVLGDTGQSKSHAINLFKEQITGAKQFSVLMSKQIDEEKLFGRLDLASIVPGQVSQTKLKQNPTYKSMQNRLESLLYDYAVDGDTQKMQEAIKVQHAMDKLRACLATLYSGQPEFITANKIPDANICYLDEIFKAGEGVLNSLLTALNEHEYVNEGVRVHIPVISFFAASNEIPNFHTVEERILKPLYDRFELKVCTKYVESKSERLRILQKKQGITSAPQAPAPITMHELTDMQNEVGLVTIPNSINDLMDNILCELRKKGIHVSDRKYFGYGPIVQAEAWLRGSKQVDVEDMAVLVNYLWNQPEERPIIRQVIEDLCKNPLGESIDAILTGAYKLRDKFNTEQQDKVSALSVLRSGLISSYEEALSLTEGLEQDSAALTTVQGLIEKLEDISREAHDQTHYTYAPLDELRALSKLSA